MNEQWMDGELGALCTFPGMGLAQVGEVLGLTAEGRAIVDFPGNPGAPVEARTVVQVAVEAEKELPQVLLVFENGEPSAPIILGIIKDRFRVPASECTVASPFQVSADGKRVAIEAETEIELRCGKASVKLRKDGKVLVKGTHITSNGSVRNRIKGGSVAIN